MVEYKLENPKLDPTVELLGLTDFGKTWFQLPTEHTIKINSLMHF